MFCDAATLDPHLLDTHRHLSHRFPHRPGHDRAIEVAGAGQGHQQLQGLGAGGGLQHVEAVQQHQADARSRAMPKAGCRGVRGFVRSYMPLIDFLATFSCRFLFPSLVR